MLIKDVESIVGLSKKSIRYYEKVGLLTPERTVGNDYRNYTEDDINLLKKIKFLRELDIPIHDLQKLKLNELALKECIQDRIKKIEEYEENIEKVLRMCNEIVHDNLEYDNLDVEKYSMEMNVLNKGGFVMKDIDADHHTKIRGAIISSVIFIFFFLFFIGLISYFQFTEAEQMPIALYIFVMAIFILPIVSIIINLFNRIKEINGGEEDEASKY